MSEADATETPVGGQEVDPFAFIPGVESRIRGLGGEARSLDPHYAFHTPYVPAANGAASFLVRFTGLRGTEGTLTLRLNMQALDASSPARLVNSERIPIRALVEQGGTMSIGFQGFPGMAYAVFAGIFDDTDAAADGLSVWLDRPAGDTVSGPERATQYSATTLTTTIRLASVDKPTLREPVSQIFTPSQLDRAALARARQLGLSVKDQPEAWIWEQLHILSALESYGLMEPGARGLLIDPAEGPVPTVLATTGMSLVAAAEEPVDLTRLHWPAAGDPARMEAAITAATVAPAAVPKELQGFDFLWSNHVVDRFGDARQGLRWIEECMDCLFAGGFALHSFLLDKEYGDGALVDGGLVERLSLTLISHGHQVAQLRLWNRSVRKVGPVPFVLLARRSA